MTPVAELDLTLDRRSADQYVIDIHFRHPANAADIHLGPDRPSEVSFAWSELRALACEPIAYGQALSRMLFADTSLQTAFVQARTAARTLHAPLRIRIGIAPDAAALHAVRWEALCDPHDGTPLFASEQVWSSRYVRSSDWQPVARAAPRQLRALVAIANPTNLEDYQPEGRPLAPVDVRGEIQRAQSGLGDLPTTWLTSGGQPTLPRIVQHLREGYPILYLVAHGAFIRGSSRLWLEDDDGSSAVATGQAILSALRDLPERPALVVLAACQSAGTGAPVPSGAEGALLALGPALVAAGVPAVLAMHGSVSMETIATFMPVLFRELQRDGQIDRAVGVARRAVQSRLDWWMPTLFMRLRDGQIWQHIDEIPASTHASTWQDSTQHQHSHRRVACDYYAHIVLPPNYRARDELLASLCATLLSPPDNAGTNRPLALHGMGGIGKSVLARALCDHPDIQAAFPDGILWATIGQTSDLGTTMQTWIHELGGTITRHAPSVSHLAGMLAQLLANRACLLIIDDVWQRADADMLRIGGPLCRMLITTRDAEIARALGARVHLIPALTSVEAIDLLDAWADNALATIDPALKARIVARLGCLPLAVKLAGAQLQSRSPLVWLRAFDARRLALLRPENAHDSVEVTFGLSLATIAEQHRRLYAALAIFKPDEPIALPGIIRLWHALGELEADDTIALLDDLHARALLELVPPIEQAEGSHPTVLLHSLLRDLMHAELGSDRGSLHCALLNAYRPTSALTAWHTLPDDGYLYDHLAYHLDASDDIEQLHGLLGHQDWLHARYVQSDYTYNGYLSDVALAWQHAYVVAHRQISHHELPTAIAACVRVALISSSIHAITHNYVPALVARAVAVGVWSVARALRVTATLAAKDQQVCLYCAILATGKLNPSQHIKAVRRGVAAALAVKDGSRRVQMLIALVPWLEATQRAQVVQEVVAAVNAIDDPYANIEAVTTAASYLPEAESMRMLAVGLAAVGRLQRPWERAEALAFLAPYLTNELCVQALAHVRALPREWDRSQVLLALAPRLDDDALDVALAIARSLSDAHWRAQALLACVLYVRTAYQAALVEEILATADRIDRRWAQAATLAAVLPYLHTAERMQTLKRGWSIAITLERESERAEALATFAVYAPYLSYSQLAYAFALARRMRDASWQVQVLAALTPHASLEEQPTLLAQALAACNTILDEHNRAEALARLAPQLLGTSLAQGLTSALAIRDAQARAVALTALAPSLEGTLLAQALGSARTLADESEQTEALAALASQVPERLATEGFAAALTLEQPWKRAAALAALAPALDAAQQAVVLDAVRALPHLRFKVRVLTALASRLHDDLLVRGLAMVQLLSAEWAKTHVLIALAPRLTGTLLAEAVQAAYKISYGRYRALALVAFAPRLNALERQTVLEHSLETARTLLEDWERAAVLVALAPHLHEQLRRAATIMAEELSDTVPRQTALASLGASPVLVADGVPIKDSLALHERVQAAHACVDLQQRARLLLALLPEAPDPKALLSSIRQDLLTWIGQIKDSPRTYLLALCADTQLVASPVLDPQTLQRIAEHIIEIGRTWRW